MLILEGIKKNLKIIKQSGTVQNLNLKIHEKLSDRWNKY